MSVAYGCSLDVFHSRQEVIEVGKRGRNKPHFLNVWFQSRQGPRKQNTKERRCI